MLRRSLRSIRFLRHQFCVSLTCRRTFLSKLNQCDDEWAKRLDTPLLKKIVLEDFYYDVDLKFNKTQRINALDVDIFTNAVDCDNFFDEMHDIVHKLRMSEDASNILPSTHHGFIRNHMKYKRYDELLRILNDRLNYGIFPDDYCNILMLNEFLRINDYKNAVNVVCIQMLQEDFSNYLVKHLSLYSCHKFLEKSSEWAPSNSNPDNDDEEEVKVRVKYIRNPYFDFHFDLTDPYHLIGKSLMLMSDGLDDAMHHSYNLLGLLLFEKFVDCEKLIDNMVGKKLFVHNDVIDIVVRHLSSKIEYVSESDKSLIAGISDKMALLKPEISSDALPIVESRIANIVEETEPKLVTYQCQVYRDWITNRDKLIDEACKIDVKNQKLEEFKNIKEELIKREEKLFFFEREDEFDLKIENKKIIYPKKWLGKKKKKRLENVEYISPENTRQTRNVN